MSVFQGKHILLGISGGIAAYKSTYLVRLFKKVGAEVKVLMTPSAADFVTPLTLSTLSQNPVYSQFVDEENTEAGLWNNHVDLALWADYMIIAPATANTMGKMVNGIVDNLLMATYLSAKCPVYIAPAMDLDMYQHPSTKHSLGKLEGFGHVIIPVGTGFLASGLEGKGRMAEPNEIFDFIDNHIRKNLPWLGKKVLITAGPTYEAIDPVRFIGNHSSGLMGVELAKRAATLGAEVTLVLGPSSHKVNSDINLVSVISAEEMYRASHENFSDADIVICAAAVSDYRPKEMAAQKIKKKSEIITLELIKNKDILASLGQIKNTQFLVGFALETQHEEANAKDKLQRKNLDAIVLNSLNDKGAGFGHPTNKIRFIDKNLQICSFSLKSKADVAVDICNEIEKRICVTSS
ncbi:MAG: bifunctional phosphopantothenoylcysteine decarboxylase/phosphopantothenate--cysteine ligase CoaBC [Flavobacteriaceae bacterium]|nr:bifunctional phosphopantothenoylcysteine decarboxylase/phosphopantothenate--cysteine ligase CoaBC [Flavobacteriaceae bacterium]